MDNGKVPKVPYLQRVVYTYKAWQTARKSNRLYSPDYMLYVKFG